MSQPVFLFDSQDPAMAQACQAAQASFRYFWRELSWERRRIIPGLDLSMVKLPFTDGPRADGNPAFEQMWIGDVDFDGDSVSGTLLNSPNWLTSVRESDAVSMPFDHLTDWMMAAGGQAYGGFTVNLMRSGMGGRERAGHDQAWGLDFGDPSDIRVEIHREPKPRKSLLSGLFGKGSGQRTPSEGFTDHPMCVNMMPKIEAQLRSDRGIARTVSEDGWTLLHQEALSGNLGIVRLLVSHGADLPALTPNGYTAAGLARKIGWLEIADYLDAGPVS